MTDSGQLLAGRVALITGASRGIGAATAAAFAYQGANLVITAKSDTSGISAMAETLARTYDVRVIWIVGDASSPVDVARLFDVVFREFKRLDILVNNAGILIDGLLGMTSLETIESLLRNNATSVLLNMQMAVRLMGRKKTGSIINLTSIIGTRGASGSIAYAASKAAVVGTTLAASKEFANSGIRVNAIAPGFIDTDMTRELRSDLRDLRVAQIGMGRIGEAAEVAKVCLFLASDLSSYVTGQVIGVDGGMII